MMKSRELYILNNPNRLLMEDPKKRSKQGTFLAVLTYFSVPLKMKMDLFVIKTKSKKYLRRPVWILTSR